MFTTIRAVLRILSCFAGITAAALTIRAAENTDMIGYHDVKTDSQGKIMPWYGSGPSQAYDHVIRLVWNFWRDMKPCPNGVPYYLQHQVWKPKEDPRGLGGDQISMALSSWNLLYDYTGDSKVLDNMRLMADYWLVHGLSKPTDKWPNLPFPYNTEEHSGIFDGDMRAGKNFLQPDKAGSFGKELITLYKITGDEKYLRAATTIADMLAQRVTAGDADNSPWPFRVNATTGGVHTVKDKGKTFRASYTTNWTGTLELCDDLRALGRGNHSAYAKADSMVSAWLKQYPLKTNKWGPFFEDVPTQDYSDTEINGDTMAMYLLDHPQFDARSSELAAGILAWSDRMFANHEFEKWGVTAINEQTAYKVPGNSHTSRHASVELRYCELTGNNERKEQAIRRLNWATYMVDTDGKNRYPRDDIWLTDGYGDYVRHYLRAMAAQPELAPNDQNHLLRTSSVIQSISYGKDRITYTKFDGHSKERLKLGEWTPARIRGGAMKWTGNTKLLEISATEKTVVIERQ
ncbi:MAG TPA: hypothetical protein VH601_07620 [Bryobacteraceae bacterium]|jgi:hypothetical protein